MSDAIFKFDHGDKLRDRMTGFVGVVTGRFDYAAGCRRYWLETLKDGDVKHETFDEERLELEVSKAVDITYTPTGGDQPNPSRQSPSR